MATVTFALPEPLHAAASRRVHEAGYCDIDEYIRQLIRADTGMVTNTCAGVTEPNSESMAHEIRNQRPVDTPTHRRRRLMTWRSAVLESLQRYCGRHHSNDVYRSRILQEELDEMIAATSSRGRTPEMTFNRVMQELRDQGYVEFVNNHGHYRFLRETT